jgi:hypothetical protein
MKSHEGNHRRVSEQYSRRSVWFLPITRGHVLHQPAINGIKGVHGLLRFRVAGPWRGISRRWQHPHLGTNQETTTVSRHFRGAKTTAGLARVNVILMRSLASAFGHVYSEIDARL